MTKPHRCVDCGKRSSGGTCLRCLEPCCYDCLDAGFLCESCSTNEATDIEQGKDRLREQEEVERQHGIP